ncbi:glycine--tRNA ligase subunit beta [Streptococcus ruminantium]|uniref:Glycine--tRNA ligase beta subunit n=1 Tax=Streptococcus ruminantium TaxID=1917441 RepID=A0ABU1B816_9STRE|nr:glycine--tRNA ligase subunit beta [Streptococcus ruminantium]MDQ8760266.1 glycine--tRNA ligase subunit beta [Streptococcus ruminantium]MDQ8769881.1 glycine--tRNA ligase subunit beta [Streptococcus ruminantium]MDQ8774966.1 glycine--tRNA ligase subunit beta [Streptococcus ruminantium]MDQ8794876.1 glycine--tRNA ligase subunit beta [Streptococcus ruminantium]MDQ8796511.1 glycine--tRNA ligase subunit beta [Streptococcus ruminantium]
MVKNLLVELGLEEIPAYIVTPAMQQLCDRMATFLTDNRLSFETIDTFSTPRRLAVRVRGLANQQTDLTEDFKGPAKKIALDADGNFTKAAEGFVRGKGLTTADIRFENIKGEEYVYVTKHEVGKPVKEVLAGIPEVLKAMTFPVSMNWASNKFAYIRPVHTMTVLLDDEVLEMDFLGISSGRISRGHRFLGQETEIASADSYEADLRAQFVITDLVERQGMIVEQIKNIEEEHDVTVEVDEDLLNEVLNLVEYPTAFMGFFDTKYLEVPEEVLVTSMKNHQRYFVVRDKAGKLLPNFISVRNGNDQYLDNVIKGNEKVLIARLEDGEFFWREDQKLKIEDLVDRLKAVTFHEKIGSLYEHMERTKVIAAKLADLADLSADEKVDLARAADIYKFDLLTGMVGEFDELQGIMGEKYALLAGENPVVAAAIREHYLPNSSEGNLPESRVGAVLALADKFDTLLSFFSVGLIPSGSNDPYALRRATQGIVRILEAFGWEIPLDVLIAELYSLNFASMSYAHQTEVMDFIRARVEKMMDSAIPKDIREAVLASSTYVVRLQLAASSAIFQKSSEASYKEAVENLSRVFNLAEKAEAIMIDEALFENDEERALAEAVAGLELTEDMIGNLDKLFALSPVIAAFFDNTMVMADDVAIKANRLGILKALAEKAEAVAVFNLLNSK